MALIRRYLQRSPIEENLFMIVQTGLQGFYSYFGVDELDDIYHEKLIPSFWEMLNQRVLFDEKEGSLCYKKQTRHVKHYKIVSHYKLDVEHIWGGRIEDGWYKPSRKGIPCIITIKRS